MKKNPAGLMLFWVAMVFVGLITGGCGSDGDSGQAGPAPRFKDARVYSFQNGDRVGTNFFAMVSGPSPEDIASFTATGPSGTFELTTGYSFRQYGLSYRCALDRVMENGTYTFTIKDRVGRTATIQKTFAYDGALPRVDPASLSPANLTYLETTAPTLSAAPVVGDYRYQILVWDMGDKAVWYSADGLITPTVTVPSGILQANTAYAWAVRVWDPQQENYRANEALWFFTATHGDPSLETAAVLSFPSSDGITNFPYARSTSTAPWDVEAFTVTGPDGQVYSLCNFQLYSFHIPVYDAALVVLDPPVSLPDGTYDFELTDKSGKTVLKRATYVYHPIPDFASEARVPEANAYFDTQRPTFSWDRVKGDPGDGTYLYSVRINDYSTGIRWYESPRSSETSFTLPADLDLPRGSSYKWRVDVIDPSGNNYRTTDYRTFTINGPV